MTYLIIVLAFAMAVPAFIWLLGRVLFCVLSLVAGLAHVIALMLFALADLLDRRNRPLR